MQDVPDRDFWRFKDKVVELISLFSNVGWKGMDSNEHVDCNVHKV